MHLKIKHMKWKSNLEARDRMQSDLCNNNIKNSNTVTVKNQQPLADTTVSNNTLCADQKAMSSNKTANFVVKSGKRASSATSIRTASFQQHQQKRRSSTTTCENEDYDSSKGVLRSSTLPTAEPLNTSLRNTLPSKCVRCNLVYGSFEAWKSHVINDHITPRDPEPKVQMNYVDAQTIMKELKSSESSSSSTISSQNSSNNTSKGTAHEQLKLTFCREKGSYVVKSSSSISDELAGGESETLYSIQEGRSSESTSSNHQLITESNVNTNSQLKIGNQNSLESNSVKTTVTSDSISTQMETELNINRKERDNEHLESVFEKHSENEVDHSSTIKEHCSSTTNISVISGSSNESPNMLTTRNEFDESGTADELGSKTSAMDTRNSQDTMYLLNKDKSESREEKNPNSVTNLSPTKSPEEMPNASIIGKNNANDSSIKSQLESNTRDQYRNIVRIWNPSQNNKEPSGNGSIKKLLEKTDKSSLISSGSCCTENKEAYPNSNDSRNVLLENRNCQKSLTSKVSTAISNDSSQLHTVNSSLIPKENGSVNVSNSLVTLPFHITLPSGIEIQHLGMPIPQTSNPKQNSTGEEECFNNYGREEQRNASIISGRNHENPSEHLQEREPDSTDADDFRCRVCNKLFSSDDEVETHFAQAHFRGIANNILEPESPCPPEQQPIFQASSKSVHYTPVQDSGTQFRDSFNSNGPIDSEIFRERAVKVPERGESVQHPPNSMDPRTVNGQSGGLSYSISRLDATGNISQSNPRNNSFPRIVPPTPPITSTRPDLRRLQGVCSSETTHAQLPYCFSLPGSTTVTEIRPRHQIPLPRSQVTQVPSGTIQQHQAHSQHFPNTQIPQVNSSKVNYPNVINNALHSVLQLGSQRYASNIATGRRLSHEIDNPRNMEIPSVIQPLSKDGTHSQLLQSQHDRHILQQRQQQYQYLQQQAIKSRQELQRQQPINDQHRISQQQHPNSVNNHSSQLHGKRPSPQEHLIQVPKQGRIEGQMDVAQGISGRKEQTNLGPTSPHLGDALGAGGLRMGPSVTLSVCHRDENRNLNGRQLSPNTNSVLSPSVTNQRSPPIGSVMRNTSGPMIPKSSEEVLSSAHRQIHHSHKSISSAQYPQQNLSPNEIQNTLPLNPMNTRYSTSESSNSVPVIQNGSPTSPPAHPFAIPQHPAPRVQSSITTMDRPDRPPTVDLTSEDSTNMTKQYQRQSRVAVSCNLCGVLFCSTSNLDEHKLHRHGIRPPPPTSAIVTPSRTGSLNPAQQQQPRAQISTIRPTSTPPSTSGRSLYMPLLDLTRLDPGKLKKLEELGVCSIIPLQGNDRNVGLMGIPLLIPNYRDGSQIPFDHLQSVGPVITPYQAQAFNGYPTSRTHQNPNNQHK